MATARRLSMRELLLAYLFGQLDVVRRGELEKALAQRPELRGELDRLRACLDISICGEADETCEPPPNLASKTCDRVAQVAGWRAQEYGMSREYGASIGACTGTDRERYTRADLSIAVGITVVAAMLLFPALHDSRVLALRSGCQWNLMQISQSLIAYAQANGGAIPHVPESGKDAFAGIYAVRLADAGFVDRQELGKLLVCPATIRVRNWCQDGFLLQFHVPTQAEIMAIPEEELRVRRKELAADYAYRFGYVNEHGDYRKWLLDHSSRSALLADSPSLKLADFQSENHGGEGLNVCFADGHVKFMCQCPKLGGDHLFMNHVGKRAAGTGRTDNVLGLCDEGPGVEQLQPLLPLR